MNSDEITTQNYLNELCRMAGADTNTQVSMHDVGAALGLEKAESGKIAEELMVQGLIELKTLAGGIGITPEGLQQLGYSSPGGGARSSNLQLSDELVLTENDRATVEQLTKLVKEDLPKLEMEYQSLEGIIIDLKTIELHLLSPRPKNSVIKELLISIGDSITLAGVTGCNSMENIKPLI